MSVGIDGKGEEKERKNTFRLVGLQCQQEQNKFLLLPLPTPRKERNRKQLNKIRFECCLFKDFLSDQPFCQLC